MNSLSKPAMPPTKLASTLDYDSYHGGRKAASVKSAST